MEGKRYLRVLEVTEAYPLGLYERLLYSYLVSRKSKMSRGIGIERWIGMSRKTIGKARAALVAAGLVKATKGGLRAVEPPTPEWFGWMTGAEGEWHRRFKYIKLYLPSQSSPLRLTDALVYAFLRYRGRKGHIARNLTFAYLGLKLGLDGRTVKKTLGLLINRHLIEKAPSGNAAYFSFRVLSPEPLGWWLDKGEPCSCRSRKARLTRVDISDTIEVTNDEQPTNREAQTDDILDRPPGGDLPSCDDGGEGLSPIGIHEWNRKSFLRLWSRSGFPSRVGKVCADKLGDPRFPTFDEMRLLIANAPSVDVFERRLMVMVKEISEVCGFDTPADFALLGA